MDPRGSGPLSVKSHQDSVSVYPAWMFRAWTPEVPDFRRLTVNKESKEDLKGIFHDLIFYPRVTSLVNLIFSPQ
jgi:hypothetical protein